MSLANNQSEQDDNGQNGSRFQVAKVADEEPKNENNATRNSASCVTFLHNSTTYYDTRNLKSLRHYTREALPRDAAYRNVLSGNCNKL